MPGLVLNALRHQRMVQAGVSALGYDDAECAQRLTASEDGAAWWSDKDARRSSACSTPYGIRGWCSMVVGHRRAPVVGVLNALRHQRMVQTSVEALVARMVKCSTPYGIRGWCRATCTVASIDRLCAQRLTASEDGAGGWVAHGGAEVRMCSTPYGIRGWCSNAPPTTAKPSGLCSTPYGIRGWCR